MENNLNNILRDLQKYAEEFSKVQEEMSDVSFTVTSGGGMVEVQINGNRKITSIKISDYLFEMQDKKMIEDLVLAAVNQAYERAETELANKSQNKMEGMMKDFLSKGNIS